jgi:hypothetical protein
MCSHPCLMKQVGHLSEALPVGRVHRPVPVQAGNQPAPAGSQPVPASHSNQQVLAGFRGSAGDAMRARSRTCQKARNSVSPTCSRTHMLGTHLRTHLKNEKESVDDEFLFIAGREKYMLKTMPFWSRDMARVPRPGQHLHGGCSRRPCQSRQGVLLVQEQLKK